MKKVCFVKSVEETHAAAREFAASLKPGDVVRLEGDLGAGKTTFVQGVAAALGIAKPVTSPTFCLAAEYTSRTLLLVHMDLYRLHNADDVLAIGWEDYLARGAALLVEWPDRAEELMPENAKQISIEMVPGEDDARKITFQ